MKAKWITYICIGGLCIFSWLVLAEFYQTVQVNTKEDQAASQNTSFFKTLADQNIRCASADIAAQFVSKMPDDIQIKRLAIGPIAGDSHALAESLTASIKAKKQFDLIEREDLDILLAEQSMQLSDVTDASQAVEIGRIKGVDGLVFGRIKASHASFAGASLEAFIKLDSVQSGDVAFAKTLYARHIPRHTIFGGIAVVFLILSLYCSNRLKKRKKRKIEQVVKDDSGTLVTIQDELKKAMLLINQAHDRLVQNNMLQLSVTVRQAREDLVYLSDRVEQTPAVYQEVIDKKTKRDLNAHGKHMQALAKNVLAQSGVLHETIKSKGEKEISSAIENLRAELNLAMAGLQERPVGKS